MFLLCFYGVSPCIILYRLYRLEAESIFYIQINSIKMYKVYREVGKTLVIPCKISATSGARLCRRLRAVGCATPAGSHGLASRRSVWDSSPARCTRPCRGRFNGNTMVIFPTYHGFLMGIPWEYTMEIVGILRLEKAK
jgi:hypothetical protein